MGARDGLWGFCLVLTECQVAIRCPPRPTQAPLARLRGGGGWRGTRHEVGATTKVRFVSMLPWRDLEASTSSESNGWVACPRRQQIANRKIPPPIAITAPPTIYMVGAPPPPAPPFGEEVG
eukprot:6220978-Pyramimonas_sp.AAC.1